MGVGADERPRGIATRRQESAARAAAEVEHAHRQESPARHLARQPRGHGAEIFADHECARPRALEREDAEQIVRGHPYVRAVGSRAAGRNPKLAEESHHVVDAERSGMAERGAHEVDPIAIAVARERRRIDRRQAPVLAERPEWIGRRADADAALEKEPGKHPRVGAARRRSKRQVLINAERESRGARMLRHRGQLAVELELQVTMVIDGLAVGGAERVDSR